jgi:AcrR family transcriptional regulator
MAALDFKTRYFRNEEDLIKALTENAKRGALQEDIQRVSSCLWRDESTEDEIVIILELFKKILPDHARTHMEFAERIPGVIKRSTNKPQLIMDALHAMQRSCITLVYHQQ